MKAEHINITVPFDLKMRLDEVVKKEHIKRSTFIQKAVKCYLNLLKEKRMRALLAEGYAEMADEAIKITKEFASIDEEAMKYVD